MPKIWNWKTTVITSPFIVYSRLCNKKTAGKMTNGACIEFKLELMDDSFLLLFDEIARLSHITADITLQAFGCAYLQLNAN